MAYTQAGKKAVGKYVKKAYDSILIRVKKGEREVIQKHAEKMGESSSEFIKRSILEAIERDNETDQNNDTP